MKYFIMLCFGIALGFTISVNYSFLSLVTSEAYSSLTSFISTNKTSPFEISEKKFNSCVKWAEFKGSLDAIRSAQLECALQKHFADRN